METIKFILAFITYYTLTILYLSIEWFTSVVSVIYHTQRLWPVWLSVLNFVVVIFMLQFEWVMFVFKWYYFWSWVIYLVYPRYREAFVTTLKMLKGLNDERSAY